MCSLRVWTSWSAVQPVEPRNAGVAERGIIDQRRSASFRMSFLLQQQRLASADQRQALADQRRAEADMRQESAEMRQAVADMRRAADEQPRGAGGGSEETVNSSEEPVDSCEQQVSGSYCLFIAVILCDAQRHRAPPYSKSC